MSYTEVTAYTVYPDCYPQMVNSDRLLWTVKVEWTEPSGWAVRTTFGCSNRKGVIDYEPQPSSRTERWIKSHRFPLDEATKIAAKVCRNLRRNGRTAQEASDFIAARLAALDDQP